MSDLAGRRARNATFWARAAPGWIRHADRQDEYGRPLGAVALDRLRPEPGERILDVGCGCGGTSAELAAAVGPAGTVVGLDLDASMVEAAAARFPGDHHPGLRFTAADIETAGTVEGAPFDAAYSRMALMLAADPVAACSAIRRALRPGGRLAATVFRDGAATPWMHAVLLGAAPHLGPLPPMPVGDEPGPFAFADRGRVTRVLAEAGFDAVTVEPHDVTLRAGGDPGDPGAVVEWLIEIGPAGAAYREAAPERRAAARAGVTGLLARFREPAKPAEPVELAEPAAGYRLPAGIWLITATVPAGAV